MRAFVCLTGWLLVTAAGCSDDITARKAEPADAAMGAMSLYDKDGNGTLEGGEIEAAPALKGALALLDANKNGALTQQELEQRFERLKGGSSAISVAVTVLGAKGPLTGANVTLTPEPYMGDGLPVYMGTTGNGGQCELTLDGKPAQVLPSGLFQAHVVHAPSGLDQVVGFEVSDDTGNRVTLQL